MPYFCRHFKKSQSVCLITLSLLMSQGVVCANTLIYGLDKAHQVNSSAKGPFYIQLASFSREERANHYLQRVKLKFSYPITIDYHHSSYAVRLGPIDTARAVREIVMVEGQTSSHISQKKPLLVSQIPTAIAPSDKPQFLSGPWIIQADMGITFPRPNHTMTVRNGSGYSAPKNVDQYSTQHHHPAIYGLQVGHRWERTENWLPAYVASVRYQRLDTEDVHGSIIQYSLPKYKNYSYRWGMRAEVLSLNGKIDIVKFGRFMPYVDAGLGFSFDRSMSYHETAYAGVTPRTSPGFASHLQSQLYYNAGIGLDMLLTHQLSASLGYEYQYFGYMESGRGQTTWMGEKLNMGNFASNTVSLGLTYAIGDSLL